MPRVSICVPVYNVEQYIGRCIESLLYQSFNDIEIIVVNDCSPDSSMQIVEAYANQDARIKTIYHERNRGLMWARKTGYDAACGEYITFCDSDDVLPLDAIKILYNKALETNADIVSGDIQRFSKECDFPCILSKLEYGNDPSSVYKSLLKQEYTHNLCSKLFKSELLHNYEYLTFENTINGEDGILFYQVVKNAKKVVHVNDIVYRYYMNSQSSTQVRLKESALLSIVIMNKLRFSYCSQYPHLEKDAWKYISKVMNDLLAEGYGKQLKIILRKEKMANFIDLYSMLINFSIYEYAFVISKRFIKPMLNRFK